MMSDDDPVMTAMLKHSARAMGLEDLIRRALPILTEYKDTLVDSHSTLNPDPEKPGDYLADRSTLDEAARPDVEELEQLIAEMEKELTNQ